MTQSLLTIDMITREALRVLVNNLAFTRAVRRDYDDSFGQSGAKIGDTLRVRLPNRYTVTKAQTLSNQDTAEESRSLALDTQAHTAMRFSAKEMALSLDDFSSRIISPAMSAIASTIDFDGMTQYQNVYNSVGTPGTTPQTARVYLDAGALLSDYTTPKDDMRHAVVNPDAEAATVDGLKGVFQSASHIGDQYTRGQMGRGLGFMFGMDQNVNRHTVGIATGTPLVNGATQTGASLVTDGWTNSQTGILKKGDVITLAGVFGVNPVTGQSTGKLQQFVVTADANSAGGGGASTLAISPSIIATGAKKTVTASPADDAAITVLGTTVTAYPQNLAFHREAFVLGTADLEMPQGVDFASRQVYEGISMRIVRQYDIAEDRFPCRVDVLYGWLTARPEFACRVWG